MSRILVVGDIHEPCSHPGYLSFNMDLIEKWNIDRVVLIGDVLDFQGISFHAKNPDCPGPRDEYEQSLLGVQKWYQAIGAAEVMIGNHDERVHRLAASVGIPSVFLRNYADVWQTPKWQWKTETLIDNTYFYHGTGCGGQCPAFIRAQQTGISSVIGHVHSAAGIQWMAGPLRRLFGMDTGCGVDIEAAQMAYGKHFARKPILSSGVVIDGIPYHEIMPAGIGEKYHRSRFKKMKKSK